MVTMVTMGGDLQPDSSAELAPQQISSYLEASAKTQEQQGALYQGGSARALSLPHSMVTMGGDLQPGSLADRLLTGLGQPQINP